MLFEWMLIHTQNRRGCDFIIELLRNDTIAQLFEQDNRLYFTYKRNRVIKEYPDITLTSKERGWKHAGMYVVTPTDKYGWKTWSWLVARPRPLGCDPMPQLPGIVHVHAHAQSHTYINAATSTGLSTDTSDDSDVSEVSEVIRDHQIYTLVCISTCRRNAPSTYRRYRMVAEAPPIM